MSHHPPYTRAIGLGVGILSASLLATEIILTRIFSVIVWYHFAFFAISVALFGTGVAAVLVHLRQHTMAPERTGELLGKWCVALAFSIMVVDLVLINMTPDWFGDLGNKPFTDITFKLLGLFALAAAPFFCGGLSLSLAMTRFSGQVHRLYFWDLAGAGSGCLLVILLLSWLGGPLGLLASSILACVSALTFAGTVSEAARKKVRTLAIACIGAALLLGALNPLFRWLEVHVAKGVNLDATRPEYNRWNSFSMVTVLPDIGFRGWGLSPVYDGPFPEQKTLVIDMNAMTPLTRFDGSLGSVGHALFDLSTLVYRVRSDPDRVCVIGAGGGRDVLAALAAGAAHVTGVEINPLIVDDVMKRRYRRFTGNLYHRSDVSVHVEDGRSFVRRAGRRFDVLLLSMVDTSAATSAGAYALTENGLYTADAFRDFLRKLKPGGVLSVSTVSLPGLYVGARLAAISRAALRSMGREVPGSVAVAQTDWLRSGLGVLHDFLVKPDGFGPGEIEILDTSIKTLKFRAAYLPSHKGDTNTTENKWIRQILTARDDARLARQMERWPFDVSAVDDDRPFFFYQNRLRDLGQALFGGSGPHLFGNGLAILAKIALVALVMVGLFLLAPLVLLRRELRAGSGAAAWDLGYVACLGLGFMFIEISLIQRFMLYIGDPTYTLSAVLFVLLTCGGIGSRGFGRLARTRSPRALLPFVFAAIAAYALLAAPGIDLLSRATLAYPPALRAALAGVAIAPAGLLLGIPFPAGLSAVSRRANTRIPWLWSINSATSVLGSILATLTSLHAGIPGSLLAGALIYACAAALWLRVGAVNASE